MLKVFVIRTFFVILCITGSALAGTTEVDLEIKYREAQREFHRGNFNKSLVLFEEYIRAGKSGFKNKDRLYWVIDQIGYIHLRVNNDPLSAIKLFKAFETDGRLNEAQQDSVSEWIGASKDWEKEKLKPQKIKDAKKLFSIGKKYFEKGVNNKVYPMDDKGNADLAIAEAYLRPFVIRYDKDPRVSEALVMMGRIKYNLRTDSEYWSENFYLKEAIRRSPGSKLAQSAWKKLNDDIHIGYSGSGGDNTPPSVLRMLKLFKQIAYLKAPKIKKKK